MDPKDVAKVESKTSIGTPDRYQTETHIKNGKKVTMGHLMDPQHFENEVVERLPDFMAGK